MEQETNNRRATKRPLVISIICILQFIVVPLVILALLSLHDSRVHFTQLYGKAYVPITVFLSFVGLIAFIGYWKMKKWGVYLLSAVAACTMVYSAFLEIYGILEYLLPVAAVLIGFAYLKRMT